MIRTPHQIALLIAFVIGILVPVIHVLIALILGRPVLLVPMLALGVLTTVVTFFVVSFGIRRFINDRINLIYRTVHDLRTRRSDEPPLDMKDDVLGRVNLEVLDWAKARRSEIKELKERERFRREFIGNVAHELKTPIFNIQGYILTLLEGGLEDEKVNRDFLERASRGVDRLTKIVEDLDMISRLESGVMVMHIKRIDLSEVVAETFEEVRLQARERGVKLKSGLEGPQWVMGDKDRLVQVFTNLLVNAINYGREGGFAEVRCFSMDDRMVVEVVDDGIGIAQEHLPRLFERFYRIGASRSRHEGGSGLGLAIVKHIMDAHGQTIVVSSEQGKGTTFTLTLQKAK